MKILLIEDNPADVLLIQQILSATLASVNIRVSMDGEQAVRMLCDSDFKPDLVILDLNIPKIPGIAVLAQCKPSARRGGVQFVLQSSRDRTSERAWCTGIRAETHRFRGV